MSRFITQADLLLLHGLSLFKIHHDILRVRFFFRVGLAGAIGLEELLDAAVTHDDHVAAFLHHAVFGLNFFQQVRDLGGQVCHCSVETGLGLEEQVGRREGKGSWKGVDLRKYKPSWTNCSRTDAASSARAMILKRTSNGMNQVGTRKKPASRFSNRGGAVGCI